MRTSSVFAVLATSALAYGQNVIQVAVGGAGGAPTFTPNNFNATNGTIVQFQFTGAPGNHTVTQSSFASPCEPVAGGFDSGWVAVPATPALNPAPEWNITINNDQTPIWFYCKQLNPAKGTPHCNLGMVGVINVGAKNFAAWTASAAAATTVGQAEGGLGGAAATATAPPFIPSGAVLVTGPTATDGGSNSQSGALPNGDNSSSGAPSQQTQQPADGGSNSSSGAPSQPTKGSARATGVNSALLFLATLLVMHSLRF
ncbi:hypothetical protein MVEN_01107400 [Mycena venus]|uniref:Extracellular serine-rich protein n=1 Tax=Mycena venus TaxID=2733690 RepID=A0A8H6Y7R0_9AGAR|nr:hypothetical protein MVEN_01107400 [Mycena venus]